jgi:hypothetical protein
MIVTDVGNGMRWTWWRHRRMATPRTAKSCGPVVQKKIGPGENARKRYRIGTSAITPEMGNDPEKAASPVSAPSAHWVWDGIAGYALAWLGLFLAAR